MKSIFIFHVSKNLILQLKAFYNIRSCDNISLIYHNFHKTGVINDPLGQTHILASSEYCFCLKFCFARFKVLCHMQSHMSLISLKSYKNNLWNFTDKRSPDNFPYIFTLLDDLEVT